MVKHQSSAADDTRLRIISYSLQEFLRQGIRRVKMDDVASALGISKRTIYEMFADKEQLLLECMRMSAAKMRETVKEQAARSKSPVEGYVRATAIVASASRAVCPQFMDDLLRYPSVVEFFRKEREDDMQNNRQFIADCIKGGYFRPDINYELLLQLDEHVHDVLRQNGFFRRYSLSSIIETVSDTHLRGMCTPKGMREMDRCLRQLANEAQQTDATPADGEEQGAGGLS